MMRTLAANWSFILATLTVSEARAIQETLYLLSVPGMRESIKEGMAEPLADSAEEPGW